MTIRNRTESMKDKEPRKWGLPLIFCLGMVLGVVSQIYDYEFVKAEAELKATVNAEQPSKLEFFWGGR